MESDFQKKIGFSIFLAKGKNVTPRQVEIPKWPQKGLPYSVSMENTVKNTRVSIKAQ